MIPDAARSPIIASNAPKPLVIANARHGLANIVSLSLKIYAYTAPMITAPRTPPTPPSIDLLGLNTGASKNSLKLANILHDCAKAEGLGIRNPMPNQKYWKANFAILRRTNCPAVLTENLFQDNKEDVKILLSPEGEQKIINLHVNAIKKYIAET